jgi:DNA-binding NtrC family response regulator
MNSHPNQIKEPVRRYQEQRPLLSLELGRNNGEGSASVKALLEKNGWVVDIVRSSSEARHRMEKTDYSVGLIHWSGIDKNSEQIHLQADALYQASRRMNLVALLPNIANIGDKTAALIHRYFYDYHTLPIDASRLLATLGHAHGMAQIAAEAESDLLGTPVIDGILGVSIAMQRLAKRIERVAASDYNVLIRGETGTGKELTAHAIHRLSQRAQGPFIPVHCGALPRDLIQAELFGHEKGAFTGADRARIGKIEYAQNGTLFLDEIGDLPLEQQTNLLRFLQEGCINRVGCSTEIPVNVRTLAATNVDLETAVEKGQFREDLYYRLNVLRVDTPPLRERGEDIPVLANALLKKYSQEINPSLKGFTEHAMADLIAYNWPGNVREMVNLIRRAVVLCEGRLIGVRDLELDRDPPNCLGTLAEARATAEKETIELALANARNNISKAARHLDISRVTLYRLMEQYGINWKSRKD